MKGLFNRVLMSQDCHSCGIGSQDRGSDGDLGLDGGPWLIACYFNVFKAEIED